MPRWLSSSRRAGPLWLPPPEFVDANLEEGLRRTVLLTVVDLGDRLRRVPGEEGLRRTVLLTASRAQRLPTSEVVAPESWAVAHSRDSVLNAFRHPRL